MAASMDLPGRGDDGDAIAASLREPARFAVVFDRHYEEISSYVTRRAGRALGEELASETFVRAFAARAGYDLAYPDARPWLYGIANNLLRKHVRSEERRRRAYARAIEHDGFSDELDLIAGRIDASAGARAVAAALARLSPVDRDTLLLFALDRPRVRGNRARHRGSGGHGPLAPASRPSPPAGRAA